MATNIGYMFSGRMRWEACACPFGCNHCWGHWIRESYIISVDEHVLQSFSPPVKYLIRVSSLPYTTKQFRQTKSLRCYESDSAQVNSSWQTRNENIFNSILLLPQILLMSYWETMNLSGEIIRSNFFPHRWSKRAVISSTEQWTGVAAFTIGTNVDCQKNLLNK